MTWWSGLFGVLFLAVFLWSSFQGALNWNPSKVPGTGPAGFFNPLTRRPTPGYWAKLDGITSLLSDQSAVPFSEEEFLWFIYESNEWLHSHSYLPPQGQDRAWKIFLELLARRNKFPQYVELFQLGEQASVVESEIEAEKRRLTQDIETARNEKRFTSGFKSGYEGSLVGTEAYTQGASGSGALIAAAGYTALSALIRAYQDDRELDAEKRNVLELLAKRSRHQLDEISVKEQAMKQQIRSATAIDVAGGSAMGSVRREVDPVIRFIDSSTPPSSPQESNDWSIDCAKNLLSIRQRIPSDPMYNRWRAEAAFWAGFFLESVALSESKDLPWGATPSKPADLAVRVFDLALSDATEDIGFIIRSHRACTLALSGRPNEARDFAKSWSQQLADDSGFAGLYARLLALSGDYGDETLKWLARAIDGRKPPQFYCWTIAVNDVRSDPSLHQLRERRRNEVMALLRPKYSWRWVDGYLSDEIYLTNESNFALSTVNLTITFSGSKPPLQRAYRSDYIGPGTTVHWKNLSISARRNVGDVSQLRCNESPEIITRKFSK